ncbi:hypothetical protein AB0C34_17435 [Nocardia sp. NPDC049220]|uniref:hypothetical protein n=1 Tax=Nocardia sp. NPDC049220 TaxID=3155273 RepID=UPI00340A5576
MSQTPSWATTLTPTPQIPPVTAQPDSKPPRPAASQQQLAAALECEGDRAATLGFHLNSYWMLNAARLLDDPELLDAICAYRTRQLAEESGE